MDTPQRHMVVRRRSSGEVTVAAPDEHTFSARWIARYLGDLVQVQVVVPTEGAPVVYELTGFELVAGATEPDGSPKLNLSGWKARRMPASVPIPGAETKVREA